MHDNFHWQVEGNGTVVCTWKFEIGIYILTVSTAEKEKVRHGIRNCPKRLWGSLSYVDINDS
jgi:hypothetical protein